MKKLGTPVARNPINLLGTAACGPDTISPSRGGLSQSPAPSYLSTGARNDVSTGGYRHATSQQAPHGEVRTAVVVTEGKEAHSHVGRPRSADHRYVSRSTGRGVPVDRLSSRRRGGVRSPRRAPCRGPGLLHRGHRARVGASPCPRKSGKRSSERGGSAFVRRIRQRVGSARTRTAAPHSWRRARSVCARVGPVVVSRAEGARRDRGPRHQGWPIGRRAGGDLSRATPLRQR